MEWTETQLAFTVDDGAPYLIRRGGDHFGDVFLPTSPMYIIFDQAVNPDLFPPSPEEPYTDVVTRVAWVRVYKDVSSELEENA